MAGCHYTSLSSCKAFVRAEIAELRSDLRGEMAGLRTDVERAIRQQTAWMAGLVLGTGGLVVAAFGVLT